MTTVITFLVALSILVFVHEWGHFIIAKLSGIRVDVFSIGFGPKIFGFKWHDTEYRIAPIPFGGYVRIYGQEPMDEAEGDVVLAKTIAEHPESYTSKPFLAKFGVVLAGPIMNILLCFALMPIVFMVGRLQPKILDEKPAVIDVIKGSPADTVGLIKGDLFVALNGHPTKNWKDLVTQIALHPETEVEIEFLREDKLEKRKVTLLSNSELKQETGYLGIEYQLFAPPLVGLVSKDSPAGKSGLMVGDLIKSIDDVTINYWREIPVKIQDSNGKTLAFHVLRNGTETSLNVTPNFNKENNSWLVGISQNISADDFIKKKYGFLEAVAEGANEGVKLLDLTFDILSRLFTGNLSIKTLGGPLQIAKATSMAAKSGLGEFVYLLAFLSLQLGVMNLLPIPVLDGGHIVFMSIEAIMRRPMSFRLRSVSMQVGLVILLGLMLFVTINDVNSIWGISNIVNSIKSFFR